MNKNKNLVIISVLTFLVALVWAITSAVTRTRQSTIPAEVEKIMTPINPKIDQELFTILEGRAQ